MKGQPQFLNIRGGGATQPPILTLKKREVKNGTGFDILVVALCHSKLGTDKLYRYLAKINQLGPERFSD